MLLHKLVDGLLGPISGYRYGNLFNVSSHHSFSYVNGFTVMGVTSQVKNNPGILFFIPGLSYLPADMLGAVQLMYAHYIMP